MRRTIFWLLLALIALSVAVNVAAADDGDGSDDEADVAPAADGQAAQGGQGSEAQVEDDEEEGGALLASAAAPGAPSRASAADVLCLDDDEDEDDEDEGPPGAPRVHSKVSVVATIVDLKANMLHKELTHKVTYSFSNKATDTFNISVVWGRLYNAQKSYIIQNFSGFEVGQELKPDEDQTVECVPLPQPRRWLLCSH